ncbi:MAG: 3-oxoacyl-ACP synthase [Verrucomicrobia bacterium]|nr:3-oxoacyl-ACP synthase [Verrucomicrobiota bacterium]
MTGTARVGTARLDSIGLAVETYVAGTGSAVPDRVVPNSEFSASLETSDEWIRERTGIRERRFAAAGERTSEYGARAARAAIADAGITPAEIGLIIVATTTPDMRFPATANFVQRDIGASNAYAYDMSVACSGFVFALAAAHAQIMSGMADCALVIGADIYSSILDFSDRKTCVLFGDGAGAVILRKRTTPRIRLPAAPDLIDRLGQGVEQPRGLLAMALHSDAGGADVLTCEGSGTAGRTTMQAAECGSIKMDGKAVFRFAVRTFGRMVEEVLDKAGFTIADVACVIPHQSNIRIVEKLAEEIGCGMDRMMMNLDKYGNTSAAAIAMALDEAIRTKRVGPGDLVLLAAVGAGFSSGAVLLRL